MYTLYYSPGAASMVVHLALLEIGAAHELRLVDFEADAQHDAQYLKLNPRGLVPTLVIDGRPMSESAAILILLADRHPQAKLAPAVASPEREAWLQWIVFLSNSLMSSFRFWFYPPELGTPEHTPTARAALQKKIEGIWDLLDTQLTSHGPYLLGAEFSAADLLLTMMMRWSRNMPCPATHWPALKQLADTVRARPSWKRLYEVEGLSEW